MGTSTPFSFANPFSLAAASTPRLTTRRFHAFSLHRPSSMALPRHFLTRRLSRRLSTAAFAALRQDETIWIQAPLSAVEPAADSLFHIAVEIGDSPELIASYTRPGQFLQLRVGRSGKPTFLAIASPPSIAAKRGELEFLVKDVEGSTAGLLCDLRKGDAVELSQVMGRGFDVDRMTPPEAFSTVVIFATGSGISPIRSFLESGFDADKRSDVRLYYGARNLQRMAYQDRFKDWESFGVKVIPVLSQPDDRWQGEQGYVQAAFARAKQITKPSSTGAVLCGHKQMAEDVTSILVADGVSIDMILKNF